MGSIATLIESDEESEGYIVTSQDVYMTRSRSALGQNEFDVMVRQVSAHNETVDFGQNTSTVGTNSQQHNSSTD